MFTTKKSILAALVAFLPVALPVSALAAEQAVHRINPLPIVYVADLQASITDHTISGNFQIQTDETGSVGNITYEAQLIQPIPNEKPGALYVDDPVIYDRFIPDQTPLALSAGEKRNVPFLYTIPNVPNGPYRLRIRLSTTNDRKLGWNDLPITITSSSSLPYAIIEADSINVKATDPITKETGSSWAPRSGPNVAAGTHIILKAFVTNSGTSSLLGLVTITTKKSLYAHQESTIEKGQEITLNPKETQELSVPITAEATPGAYQVLVSLNTKEERISGIAEYRYVVEGSSATVASAVLREFSPLKGGTAVVDFTVAGSADRTQSVHGTLEATLSDSKGTVGTVSNTLEITRAAPVQGTATIPLERALCGTPSVTITLHSSDRSTLDTFTTPFSDRAISCNIPHKDIIAGNAVLLLILGVLIWFLINRQIRHKLPHSMILMAIASSGALLLFIQETTHTVQANGVQYLVRDNGQANDPNENNQPILTVSSPIHNSTVANGPVYYSAEYTWINCGNADAHGRLKVLAPTIPAEYTGSNSAAWTDLSSNQNDLLCSYCHGDSRPRRSVALSGTLTPPGMGPGITTTIWTQGTNWGWLGAEIHDYTTIHVQSGANLISENLTIPASPIIGQTLRFTANAKNIGVLSTITQAQTTPSTRNFDTDISMIDFVVSKGYPIGTVPSYDPALRGDAATEQKVCQLAGYTTVTFTTDTNRFTTPGDNEIAYWNGNMFVTENATSVQGVYNPAKLDNLICSNPPAVTTVQHTEPATAGPSKSAFCIDNTTTCKNSSTGRITGPGHDIPSLTAGQSSATFTSDPWTATVGAHTVTICSDVNNQVTESDENDNCMSASFTVTNAPSITTPNLTIQNLTVPASILVGQRPTFSVITTNVGNGNAGGSVTRFCVDNASTCRTSKTGEVSDHIVPALATNTSSPIIFSDPNWLATAGAHVVTSCANAAIPPEIALVVPEINTADNCMNANFTVSTSTISTTPQCSNGVDDSDPEDILADIQDPGCHTDGNPNNPVSFDPNDNDETNPVPGPASTVDLKANNSDGPITIPSGTSAVLSWISTHSDWCWGEGWGGWKTLNSSESTGPITSSRAYTLRCGKTGELGALDSVTVNVENSTPASPTVDLIGPSSVITGSKPVLSWTSTNATSCTASNSWLHTGPKTTNSNGEVQGAITSPTTYTLQCSGAGGSASDSVTVNITSTNGNNGGSGGFQETR